MARRRADWVRSKGNPWSKWVLPVRRGYRFGCCDCGLVHEIDFRHVDGRIQYRVKRDNRATAALRREAKKRGEAMKTWDLI
jgi:hypothetical protein